jgi:hypothetical protein
MTHSFESSCGALSDVTIDFSFNHFPEKNTFPEFFSNRPVTIALPALVWMGKDPD